MAPLPTRSADRGLLREKADAGEQIVRRLGRLSVKTTKGDGDVDVSIESENRRCLRLFRKSEQRVAAGGAQGGRSMDIGTGSGRHAGTGGRRADARGEPQRGSDRPGRANSPR